MVTFHLRKIYYKNNKKEVGNIVNYWKLRNLEFCLIIIKDSILFGFKRLRLVVVISPALLKSDSDGTELAGMEKSILKRDVKWGNSICLFLKNKRRLKFLFLSRPLIFSFSVFSFSFFSPSMIGTRQYALISAIISSSTLL